MTLRIQIPDVYWTKALLAGVVKVDGFSVAFEPSIFDQRSSRRLRGDVEGELAATEQVLTDFIVRFAKGLEQDLLALPVFITRGMVHRKLVMRRDCLSPKNLTGKVVGMGRVLGATSVFLRSLLADDFAVQRDRVRWIAAEPISSDAAMGGEWRYLSKRESLKASELIPQLSSGKLDAVLYPGGAGGHWFNWAAGERASQSPSPYGDLEAMVLRNPDLYFPIGDVDAHVEWFRRTQIYPLYHCLAVRREITEKNPGLCHALIAAFDRASEEALRYMSAEERNLCERERELLGVDPNRCGLIPLHVRTVDKCIDYLEADGFLPSRPNVEEIFSGS